MGLSFGTETLDEEMTKQTNFMQITERQSKVRNLEEQYIDEVRFRPPMLFDLFFAYITNFNAYITSLYG